LNITIGIKLVIITQLNNITSQFQSILPNWTKSSNSSRIHKR